MLRDTSKFSLFKSACGTSKPSLRKLSEKVLHVKVQSGEHNSVSNSFGASNADFNHTDLCNALVVHFRWKMLRLL